MIGGVGNNHFYITNTLIAVLCLLLTSYCQAAPGAGEFSVTSYLGLHQPAIDDLNRGELLSPISGTATIVDFETDLTSTKRIFFENPLAPMEFGVNAGIELQWRLDDKWFLIFGGGTWEAASRSTREGPFAIQGVDTWVENVRSVKLSYTEFFLGLRRDVWMGDKRHKLFYRITLNEMFDIDFQENLLFRYKEDPAKGVNKTILMNSQATGILALQPGFGWEYFLNKWMSLGVDASYFVGLRRADLQENGAPRRDFLFSDNLNLWLPQRIGPGGTLEYLGPNALHAEDYRPIKLNFDGWKVLLRLSIHY